MAFAGLGMCYILLGSALVSVWLMTMVFDMLFFGSLGQFSSLVIGRTVFALSLKTASVIDSIPTSVSSPLLVTFSPTFAMVMPESKIMLTWMAI